MENEYNIGDMIMFYRNDVEGMLQGVIDSAEEGDNFVWVLGDDGMEYEVYYHDIEGLV